MPHSCSHPCPFCTWLKGKFGPGDLRTFEGIRKAYCEWIKAGAIKKDAKEFFNCINLPISLFPEVGLVLLYIPPPGLHVMMGVVDKLLTEMTRCYLKVELWPEVLLFQIFCMYWNFLNTTQPTPLCVKTLHFFKSKKYQFLR